MALALVAGCQTTEEKVQARYQTWFAACGYPVISKEIRVTPEEERELRACVSAYEASYQAERAQNISKGAALLGYGSALMATPPAQGPKAPMTCNSTIMPNGRQMNTTCW